MPTTPDNDELLRRLHDVYQQPPPQGPIRTPGNDAGLSFLFKDAQPGTAAFTATHLVGSSAPEPVIERYGAVGAEGFGPVELIDGRTGHSIARVNRHLRRRLEER
jgi:hypothetical protein